MPKIFNPKDLEFIEDSDTIDKFNIQTVIPRMSKAVDSKHLVFDLRMLDSYSAESGHAFRSKADTFLEN